MNNLAHYVRVYDDVFEPEFCNKLIKTYDGLESSEYMRKSEHSWEQDYRSFVEVNICSEPAFKDFVGSYYSRVDEVYKHYKSVVKNSFYPPQYSFEDGRMKKYEANDHDQFGWHVDVGDKYSAERFLVMFCYLNDVAEGGETEFESDLGFTVEPKCGRIVVFPPMWMWPHRGKKPISNSKYILSTYLHYV